ncbi:MAG: hypothetical protein IT252_15900 [Chitinophagaceae bacterium]|nr:hypothetical protein [Chitinophagaceae bacterium]
MHRFIILFYTALIFTGVSIAQPAKSLRLSFGAGVYNSPYYHHSLEGGFYRISFEYHLAKRHILSAMYLTGKHYYVDINNTNVVMGTEKGNRSTRTNDHIVGALYQYKMLNKQHWEIMGGAGLGLLTKTEDYTAILNNNYVPFTSTWTDLVFPTNVSLYYKPAKDWHLGIVSGMVIHPDFPLLGWHFGAKLAYVIQ